MSSPGAAKGVGPLLGVLAAVSFGLGLPFARLLVAGGIDPYVLAGLAYLSAAGLLGAVELLRLRGPRTRATRALFDPLQRSDLPWLVGVAIAGALAGPVLLFVALRDLGAAPAALLLNFELVFTVAIACLAAGETIGRRGAAGLATVLVGGLLLTGLPGFLADSASFPLLASGMVLLAAFCWAVDNNLTQHLSRRSPFAIAAFKGAVGGAGALILAALSGASLGAGTIPLAAVGLFGLLTIGLSLLAYIGAQRALGTTLTAGLFATAPLTSVAVAALLLEESLGGWLLPAAVLMFCGSLLLLTDRHAHLHRHPGISHQHWHEHDLHHDHGPRGAPAHGHAHEHTGLLHQHPHCADLHHRHPH